MVMISALAFALMCCMGIFCLLTALDQAREAGRMSEARARLQWEEWELGDMMENDRNLTAWLFGFAAIACGVIAGVFLFIAMGV